MRRGQKRVEFPLREGGREDQQVEGRQEPLKKTTTERLLTPSWYRWSENRAVVKVEEGRGVK